MGLLEKIFPKKKEQPASSAASSFQTFTAYSPVFVNHGGAIYENELIRAAIDAKARHISKLKADIIGAAQPQMKSLCKHAPNSFQTWSQFLYRLATILETQNTAFIVPIKNKKYNTIIGFYAVLPSECRVVAVNDEPYLQYKFASGQMAAERMQECGIMNKFQYRDEFFGESNRALASTMDLVQIQNKGIEEAVKNSNTFRFMARMTNFTTDEDLAKAQKRYSENALQGDGGVLLFPNTWTDIKQINSAPYTVDAAQMKAIKDSVSSYFGVSEEIMQGRATYEQLDAFYESSVEPFAIQLSEVMTKMAYTFQEQSYGNKILITANRLQYMAPDKKLNMVTQLSDRGMMSINEGREIFNMSEVEGGDVRIIRGEYYNGADKLSEEGGSNE
ncbi:MAG: phage portal protein [Eubacterium sp.]|nr:phage portal protein [Candidatus Colimonas fimequi]